MSQPDKTVQELSEELIAEEAGRELLTQERQKLDEERRKFEREKKEFYFKQEMEEKRLTEEARLFQMKWKILEGELQRLAKEKKELEIEKEHYYHKYNSYEEHSVRMETDAEMFFSGVNNELALKKRYKELIKIYHPDNLAGDTVTLQMINKTYDILKQQFTA